MAMKVCLMLSCSLFVSACLLAITKVRRIELEKDERQRTFLDIKYRVTLDLWSEYLRQIEETNRKIEEAEALEKSYVNQINAIQGTAGNLKTQLLECAGKEKTTAIELDTATKELTYRTAEYKKEVDGWEKEKADLKKQLSQQSLVCDFLKPNSKAVRNFCGNKVIGTPNNVQPKVEAPKP